ncbi:MAG TPA: alpha/beta hydrolase [Micromonosporaceae bacterium]|nr:alpha/beta hydrolase [Micromonosporaceae bacterium]
MRSFRWPPPPEGKSKRWPAPRGRDEPGRPLVSLTPTELRAMPHGPALEYFVSGDGEPTTVFAHGLAGGIPDTRPLGSGVAGRKVFFQFRGHGRSDPPPEEFGYADLADDLRGVADEFGASRAVGVSLGAGALCGLLAQTPDRFERVVFFMPAVLDEPRPPTALSRARALVEAIEAEDAPAAAGLLAAEIPAALRDRPAAWRYVRERLDGLLRDGLSPRLVTLTEQVALPDRGVLSAVKAPALVIGCRGDSAHPAALAERLADVLPNATLHIYQQPAVLWTNRSDLRARISEFLNT